MCDCKSKIAPPAEEQEREKVTIEHDQWGRVEGVEKAWSPRDLSHWVKEENGRKMIFNESKGWREVKPKRWVPVETHIYKNSLALLDGSGARIVVPQGYRWKTAEIEKEVNY